MATYRLRADCFLNGVLQPEGTVIQVSDSVEAGLYWEALNASAKKVVEKRNKANPNVKRILSHRPTKQNPESVPLGIKKANKEAFLDEKTVKKPVIDTSVKVVADDFFPVEDRATK